MDDPVPTTPRAMLSVMELSKSFGGIKATDGVSFELLEGEVHGLIGPNGAGKSTLIAQLCGQLQPDSGDIRFDGQSISTFSPHQRARIGMARSFQVTSVFMEMSVLDNVALAVQAQSGHSFRFWRKARLDAQLVEPALFHLKAVGLSDRAHSVAAALSHGERRQLEIAISLAGKPKLLLLDEPMAGLGSEESQQMVAILKSLRGTSMLLVEHDMDAVFALADRISVLVYGQLIATGTPEEIRANREVATAYLGDAL